MPAVIDAKEIAPASVDATRPMIELDIGGDSMWIWRDADIGMVTAVIGALKKNQSGRA